MGHSPTPKPNCGDQVTQETPGNIGNICTKRRKASHFPAELSLSPVELHLEQDGMCKGVLGGI